MRTVPVAATIIESKAITNVDSMASAMADGLRGEYVQLESKPFSARWAVVRIPGIVVQFGREDIAVVRRVRVPADRWSFVIPLVVPGSARWNGCAIKGGELIVCAPKSESYAFDPGGTRFVTISVPVRAAGGLAIAARGLVMNGQTSVLRPSRREFFALREELTAMDRSVDGFVGRHEWHEAPALAGLSGRLLACMSATPCVRLVGGSGRSPIVRRAEDFFRRHVGEPVSIAQLSAIAGVSERSLRNAFYHVYTIGPKRYLKLWQLHQVHHALQSDGRADATVTDVATLHGFYELGRFAGEYKALFGEAPSHTLQRARGRNASSAVGAA
jgi:AraC-like DNA-binding protein